MSNIAVATEIMNQLGGRKFIAMTGCKNFVYDDRSLIMKLGRNQSKAKYLKITLTPGDVYLMQFMKIDGSTVKEINMVYNDMLVNVFESETGLVTKL